MFQSLSGLNNIQMIFVGDITLRIIIGHNNDLAVTAPRLPAPEGLTRCPNHLGEGTWNCSNYIFWFFLFLYFPTCVALHDVGVGAVGEGGVAPVPVGGHVSARHVRHLLGQGGGGQDGQWPQQQVLPVLTKKKSQHNVDGGKLMFYLFWILIMEFVCVSQIVRPVLRLPAETGVQLQSLHAVSRPQEVVPVQQLSHKL